jgi:DNA-binding NarL/FixJ family response regulator
MNAPIRVLIVDDDVPTRVGLRVIMDAESDIEVVGECASAEESYDRIVALAPDIVLMDVQLPGADGLSATAHIMSNIAGAKSDGGPRVIVLTTYEIDDYVYRSLDAGASGFLLKRAPAEDLAAAVRSVASGDALPVPTLTKRLIEQFATRSAERSTAVDHLTERERQVLLLIARGRSNHEISADLSISPETVKSHVKHIFAKLGVRDRAQAVIAAYESGLAGQTA